MQERSRKTFECTIAAVERRAVFVVGGLALAGALAGGLARRRRSASAGFELEPAQDARAEELRRKLEQARGLDDERDEFEAAETPIDVVEPGADLEARRRAVHERGRAAANEMRGSPGEGA